MAYRHSGVGLLVAAAFSTSALAQTDSHFPLAGTVIDAIDMNFGGTGGSYVGNLASGTWDWFTFFGQSGNAVQLNVDANGGMTDPALTLYGVIPLRPAQAGDITEDLITLSLVLAQNDDFNGLFPQINFVLPSDGWYVAAIGGFGGNSGSYLATLRGNTPAPSTLALLGLSGLVAMRRRRG